MPELCYECTHRSEFLEFQERALKLESCLSEILEYPDGIDLGGRAFLGRHYAHSRSILLTLNPRPNPSQGFSARLLALIGFVQQPSLGR